MNAVRALIHTLLRYHAWEYKPAVIGADTGHIYGPFLVCVPCNEISALDREPPAGHPDSVTRELPREQEAWLAAIDAALWPKESV